VHPVFRDRHFIEDPANKADWVLAVTAADPATGQVVRTVVRPSQQGCRDIGAQLRAASAKDLGDGDMRRVALLADLLDKMWALDPHHRITISDAMVHPFIKESSSAGQPRP